MRLDDGPADRQAEPHALALGRDEGLEKLCRDLRRETAAGVGDAYFHGAVVVRACSDLEFTALAGLDHDLDGIADQVDQNLLDLDAVRQNRVGIGSEPEGYGDTVLPGADQGQRAGVLDQLGQALGAAVAVATGHELTQPARMMSPARNA